MADSEKLQNYSSEAFEMCCLLVAFVVGSFSSEMAVPGKMSYSFETDLVVVEMVHYSVETGFG